MRESLKTAVRLANSFGSRHAVAAHVLDGCRVGKDEETIRAWEAIGSLLPSSSRRSYDLSSFVWAVYTVEDGRYRALSQNRGDKAATPGPDPEDK